MTWKDKDVKSFNRRFLFLSSLKGMVFLTLGWRLIDLQFRENQKYEKLSEKNQFNFSLVLPERGQILDRKNRVLAGNRDAFSLILNWNKNTNVENIIFKIKSIISISEDEIVFLKKRISDAYQKKIKSQKLLITKNLSQKDVSRLAVQIINFPDLNFVMSKKRIYPQGGITSHITGYTGVFTSLDLKNKNIPKVPGLDIGKSGLEKYFDNYLRGDFGRKRDEVTARGLIIDSNLFENPTPGRSLKTSIDLNIQSYALDRLEKGNSKIVSTNSSYFKSKIKKSFNQKDLTEFVYVDKKNNIVPPETGSIVVMDVNTGEIICSVSSPHFNPNIFSRGVNLNEWELIKNNPRSPLLNRSVAGLYPPGSTIKMAIALAALENEIINFNSNFFCNGVKEFGNMKFHCWAKNGHGRLNLTQAIERSCDVYFYELGLKVGIEKIAKMLRKLGLGERPNMELNEMRNGLVPSKSWKLKKDGIGWTPGETINASIGQGYMLTSPIQLATMISRLANGNYAIEPTLLKKKNNFFKKLNIKEKNINFIKNAMQKVVGSNYGTAKNSKIGSSKYEMAGKTGTVQVVRISELEREKGIIKNIDRNWKKRDHALFVGYAPINKPKYGISVVVEHGGSGSSMAAPIARDIFKKLFKL